MIQPAPGAPVDLPNELASIPPRRKPGSDRVRFAALAVLAAIQVAGCGGGGGDSSGGSTTTTTTSPTPPNPYSWDTSAPTTAASPAGGSYNTAQSVTLACSDSFGSGCNGTYYTLDGSAPSLASAKYTAPVVLSANTTLRFFSVDLAGNAEAPKQEVYVIDIIPPTVMPLAPAANATGVKVDTAITAQFSEPMRPLTINTSTVLVDNGVTGTVAYDEPTRTLIFTPWGRLQCNTPYTATVTGGALDLAGNGVAPGASWTFTTSTDCTEPRTTASLAAGVYGAAQNVTLSCSDTGSGCARIVYTTDGSVPSFDPVNGTVVAGATASPIPIAAGDTRLRFWAEDNAGQREPMREVTYTVSTAGFTYAATRYGLSRGVGPAPASFVNIRSAGQIFALFYDPVAQRLYRGTNGRLDFSDDNGAHWSSLPVDPYPISVYSVYAAGSRIYAGTDSGLKISVDGGASFVTRTMTAGLGSDTISGVVASGRYVYVAASTGGVSISTNGGASFVTRTTANGLGSTFVYGGIAVSGSTIYAGTTAGLSVSTDGGATFVNRTTANGLGSNTINEVFASGGTVYAATQGGLSFSTDGGATFQNRTTADGLASNSISSVYSDGTNLYAAAAGCGTTSQLAVSTNGGASFTSYPFGVDANDCRAINAIHAGSGKVLAATVSGVHVSTNGGASFALTELPENAIGRVWAANGRLYATIDSATAYADGLAISDDYGQSFTLRTNLNGLGSSRVGDLFVVPGASAATNTVYAATLGGLSISTNGGTSFVNRNSSAGLFANSVESTFVSGSTVYAGTNNSIDRSVDGGTSFTTLQTLNSGVAQMIFASGSNVYVAATNGLWVSTNGTSFVQKTTANGLGANYLYAVAAIGSTVYAGQMNAGLAISADGGQTFGASSYASGNAYAIRPSGAYLYLGSSSGLGISTNGGASFAFRTTSHGLGDNVVYDATYAP